MIDLEPTGKDDAGLLQALVGDGRSILSFIGLSLIAGGLTVEVWGNDPGVCAPGSPIHGTWTSGVAWYQRPARAFNCP